MNKNKHILIILLALILAVGLLTGCDTEKPVDEPVSEAPEVEEGSVDEVEEIVEEVEEEGKFTDSEIDEMYGEDEMLYSVAKEFIGSEMPNVELIDRDGQSVMLYDLYSDGPYILEVMGTWCPVCEKTLSHAEEFNERNDVPFILISSDESIEEVAAFVGDYDVPFYVAKDPIAFNDALYVPFVPASMFVDSDGIIQMVGAGEIDVEFIEYVAGRSF